MSSLLVFAVPDPGQGVAPPGSGKLLTILQWTAWGVFALCVAGRAAQRRQARARPQPGLRRRQPAHHQPRLDARRLSHRRQCRRDRRRPRLTAAPARFSRRAHVHPARAASSQRPLPMEPPQRAALRRLPARAHPRRNHHRRKRRWRRTPHHHEATRRSRLHDQLLHPGRQLDGVHAARRRPNDSLRLSSLRNHLDAGWSHECSSGSSHAWAATHERPLANMLRT
jgi:hypothetical protein